MSGSGRRHHVVLRPTSGWRLPSLAEIWPYRELLGFLAWRDVIVRYKQAVLGVSWAVIQPVLAMGVFTVIFGTLADLPSDGQPYALMVLSGLVPWQLFANALERSGKSLVANKDFLTKIYFPRLVVPAGAIGSAIVDFLIGLVVLAAVMVYFGAVPTAAIWLLPAFALLAVVTAFAVGLWVSAANVLYRDVEHALPFVIQMWLYLSPVAYTANLVPEGKWSIIYGLNPMAGVVQGFRWALIGGPAPSALIAVSVAVVLVLLVGGLLYFNRVARRFADVV